MVTVIDFPGDKVPLAGLNFTMLFISLISLLAVQIILPRGELVISATVIVH